ncbi:UbiD family decarboxylase [Actinokineospora diospyrosa]|uniref:4-hydroxy-3-polyprenylbenzoate decarboxylase n=1 Tax=Actinokineospora diospyrosa TaxID=103728 RepID=A0ABT1IFQ9_9PSEU|nr:UbiD family decarboxylase [Actinokineospora diospyrosa]MCP2271386.1 4-hydroxy-3-polyprenylbenzoate decarboxylase [Actinokineospora diospyrosa]
MTAIPTPRSPMVEEPTALSLRAALRRIPPGEHGPMSRLFRRDAVAADFVERFTGLPSAPRSEMVVQYQVPDTGIPLLLGVYGDINRVRALLPGLPRRANQETVNTLIDAAIPPVHVMRARDRWPHVDLYRLPMLTRRDAERYLTLGVAYANRGDAVVLSAHRMLVLDQSRLAVCMGPDEALANLRAEALATGERLPVSVNIGAPPAATVASALTSQLWPVDKLALAGALAGAPVALTVGAKTTVLADSEIVLEGYLDETMSDGRPVLTVTGVTARPEPLYQSMLEEGREQSVVLGLAGALSVARAVDDELVTDVHHSPAGGGMLLLVVSVRKRSHADDHRLADVARRAFDRHPFGRLIVFTDDDVDASCAEDVLWAMATRGTPRSEWPRGDERGFIDATLPFGRA